MGTRKMATVVSIDDVVAIKGADRLEVARVKGWNVVVPKYVYQIGDRAVYFEIDTFLPETDLRFESFQKRGQKKFIVDNEEVNGHVLKTIKLRGVVSQGLLMTGDELGINLDRYVLGADVSNVLNVVKYDAEKPKNGDIIGEFDARRAPKTDAERIQNLVKHWDDIKKLDWEATVKVDGTSQTLFYDSEEKRVRIFGRNWELSPETEGMKVAEEYGLVDVAIQNPEMVISWELAGPGIQKNGLMLPYRRPFVFAVWKDGKKLPISEWNQKLVDVMAPQVNIDLTKIDTVDDLLDEVSTVARGNITKDKLDEGIVFHLTGEYSRLLPNWMDRNANFKVISNKWLIKNDK